MWRATRPATATSLAVLAWAAAAPAQTPPPAKGGAAITTWQSYPAATAAPRPPAPPVSVAPPAPTGPIGSRVVLFSKPAGELHAVQATDVPAKPVQTPPPSPILPGVDPDRPRVFGLITDDELLSDRTGGRKSVLDQIPQMNQTDEARYKREMDEYQRDPTKPKPKPPRAVRVADFVVNLGGLAVPPPVVTKGGYGPAQVALEPGYVVHRRLFFEEKNSERYGWDLGMAQPFVSVAYFYKDALLWPAKLTSSRERFDTSAGKCPPGSPVPYYLYPPEITIRGGLWEAAAVVGVVMLLP